MRAAMAKDRLEVAARGPATASHAKKLPSGMGASSMQAVIDEADAEDNGNAR